MENSFDTLKKINQIIERDSKDTTYKFALLRSAIEAIQSKTPYKREIDNQAILPVGLLVLKWIEYYYPIIDADLPQKNGDKITSNTLAFRILFKEVTTFYKDRGGFSVFYSELIKGKIPEQIEAVVFRLCKKICHTIKNQPMQYIGRSVYGDTYQIFVPINSDRISRPTKLDAGFLIQYFGEFSIPKSYYDVFELMGSFITGTHSILLNWAEFTVDRDRKLSMEEVLQTILSSPHEVRNVQLSEKIYRQLLKQNGSIECVWSGKSIKKDLNIDHILPFSVWRNNDLWNLVPAKAAVNNTKRDKIPGLDLLTKRKDSIITYWKYIREKEQDSFEKEMNLSLITKEDYKNVNWENIAFEALKDKSKYLIETRGFEEFHYA